MRTPLAIRFLADKIGLDARDFAAGWANGLARWRGRQPWPRGLQPGQDVGSNPFPDGSVSAAASEAAVAYMRELAARP